MRTFSFLCILSLISAIALAAPTHLHVGIEDANNAPYGEVQNGKAKGFHVDVVNAVARELKWQIDWRPLPWNRALSELKQGTLTALVYMSENVERSQYTDFLPGNELHQGEMCLIVREEDLPGIHFDGTWKSLKGLRIGKPDGYWFSNDFEAASSELTLSNFNGTSTQGMDMLVLKRIDVYVDTGQTPEVRRFRDKSVKLATLTPCLLGDVRFIGFSKKFPKESAAFAKAMKMYRQTKSYKRLLWKYSIKSNVD